jgi:hypothetical protein
MHVILPDTNVGRLYPAAAKYVIFYTRQV